MDNQTLYATDLVGNAMQAIQSIETMRIKAVSAIGCPPFHPTWLYFRHILALLQAHDLTMR